MLGGAVHALVGQVELAQDARYVDNAPPGALQQRQEGLGGGKES